MKKISFSAALLLVVYFTAFCQTSADRSPAPTPKTSYSVKSVSKTNWNSPDGIPFKKVPGFNLGVASFEVMDKNRIAFLSDASGEILISDRADGKTKVKFPVGQAPRDFVYEGGNFFVLGESQVSVFDEKGNQLKNIPFPGSYPGVGRVTRFHHSTWLLLPSGNSVELETGSTHSGWITASGDFVTTSISAANSYKLSLTSREGSTTEKTFSTNKKVAGVYVVGCTKERMVIDVQTYITESPISVERHLIAVSLANGEIGEIVSDLKIPDVYYVISNKEFSVESDGSVIHMITSPDGLFLFSLNETDISKAKKYPAALSDVKYHFNDHLLQANEQK